MQIAKDTLAVKVILNGYDIYDRFFFAEKIDEAVAERALPLCRLCAKEFTLSQ